MDIEKVLDLGTSPSKRDFPCPPREPWPCCTPDLERGLSAQSFGHGRLLSSAGTLTPEMCLELQMWPYAKMDLACPRLWSRPPGILAEYSVIS